MADFHPVRSRFETQGVFWDLNVPDQKFSAHLHCGTRIVLTLAAEIAGPRAFFPNPATDTPVPDTLYGFTTTMGPCTLIGLHGFESQRYMHGMTSQAALSQRYVVDACILGCHLESDVAPLLKSAWFAYTGIDRWLPGIGEFVMTETAVSTSYPLTPPALIDLCIPSIKSRVEVTVRAHVEGTRAGKRFTAESRPLIIIEPVEPRPLEWFVDLAWRFENFFSLCLGTSVQLRAVSLQTANGEDGWLIARRKQRKVEKPDLQSWVRCDYSRLAGAMAAWLAAPDAFRAVENLVYGAIYSGSLVVETEFLSLAQAVESFHRITEIRQSKKASLRQRIESLVSRIRPEAAQRLLGDMAVFEQTLRETRDYFTHLGIKKKSRVLTEPSDLFLFNQKLRALLRLLMFLHLGFTEADVGEPVLYQSSRWRIS